jgi:hypothetical protein
MSVYMSSYIEIGNYMFRNRVHSVRIESSWKELTSTATIKLPNFQRLSDKMKVEKIIKVGDPVLIKLGYDDQLYEEYRGYVSLITPGYPLEVNCEDEMWQLKQKTVSYSWRSVKLSEVLSTLVPTATIECPDITLSPFRLDKVTIAHALDRLKEEFMLVIYFRGNKLYAGLAYQEKGLGEVNYHFQKNAIMRDLKYRRKEDLRIKVKGIIVAPDNSRKDFELGDDDGDQTTIHFYNKTLDEAKTIAKETINRLKYDGYRGMFIGKGIPRIKHGQVANLGDSKYPERAGSYFADKVTTLYDSSVGFNREIEPGRMANTTLIG